MARKRKVGRPKKTKAQKRQEVLEDLLQLHGKKGAVNLLVGLITDGVESMLEEMENDRKKVKRGRRRTDPDGRKSTTCVSLSTKSVRKLDRLAKKFGVSRSEVVESCIRMLPARVRDLGQ